jgi:hypothetical protein
MIVVSETVQKIAGSPRVQEVIYVSVNPETGDSFWLLAELVCWAIVVILLAIRLFKKGDWRNERL